MGREYDKLQKIDPELRKHWADVDRHETDRLLAQNEADRQAAERAAEQSREAAQRRAQEL